MKNISKAFNIIGNILFYLFVACVIAYLAMIAFGIRPFITMSGSMEPNIHTGSLCFVNTKAEYDKIQTGDVIAFRTPLDSLVTHRVISVTEMGLETQGDANNVSDGISTTPENFYGETLFSIPYLGYAVSAFKQPQVKLIVVVIAATILILGNVDSFLDRKEKKKGAASQEAAEAEQSDTAV